MKQRLGAVARGFAVSALSGLLAAGGCISQRANENTTAHGAAVQTSRVTTVNHGRAWNIIHGLRSNKTSRTRYLGPADPASSLTTRTTSIGDTPVMNGQNASPSVATNLTGPVSGSAYYVGTAAGTEVNAGVAGTNLTGTAIVPGPAGSLGNTVVGGMAPGADVIAEGVAVPAATTGTATMNASAAATLNAPKNGAGVAGTVTAPGVAGPISTRTLTGTATIGAGTSTQTVVTPGVASNVTATARIALRPSKTTTSNATVNAASTGTTTSGARINLGATPLTAQRDASGRVVVTNQTLNQQ